MPLTTDKKASAASADFTADQEDQDAAVVSLVENFLDPMSELLREALLELEESVYAQFKKITEESDKPIESVQSYFLLSQQQKEIADNLSHIKVQLLEMPEKMAKSDEIIAAINIFNSTLQDRTLSRFADFLDRLMADRAMLRAGLFSNIELTEKNVDRIYKKLAFLCHPDKSKHHPKKEIFEEFFKILREEKDRVLRKLETERNGVHDDDGVRYHQEKADYYWSVAIDWQNAGKPDWELFKILKPREIENKMESEKRQFKVEFAMRASEQYRAASHIIDRQLLSPSAASLSSEKLQDLQRQQVFLRKKLL